MNLLHQRSHAFAPHVVSQFPVESRNVSQNPSENEKEDIMSTKACQNEKKIRKERYSNTLKYVDS